MSKMNRRHFVKTAVAGGAVATIATPAIALADDKPEKVRLRMQTYWGKEADESFEKYTDNVKLASGKSIRIKRYPSSALVPDGEMFSAVSKGTIDMCQGYGGYWPGKLDIAMLEAGIIGAWVSTDEANYVFQKALLEAAREAYAEHNIHYLAPVFGGAFDLLTKEPVKSLDDLKGMKIRATPSVAKVLQQFDIPTVFMPSSELYVALSTGAIDGVIYGGPIEYTGMKLYEVAKHYTKLNMLFPGFADCVLINKTKWDSLSDEQKAVLEMATIKHAVEHHNWLFEGGIEDKYTEHFTFNSLSEDDAKKLREAAKVLWEEEAKKSERNKKVVELLHKVAEKR